jgi:hypothetical protein
VLSQLAKSGAIIAGRISVTKVLKECGDKLSLVANNLYLVVNAVPLWLVLDIKRSKRDSDKIISQTLVLNSPMALPDITAQLRVHYKGVARRVVVQSVIDVSDVRTSKIEAINMEIKVKKLE